MAENKIITSSEFNEETHSYKTIKARKVVLKKNYKFVKTNIFYLIYSDIFVGIVVFFIWVYAKIFLASKIVNSKFKKEVSKTGALVVANHVHPLDSFIIVSSFYPRRLYPLTLKSNFGLPIAGFIQKSCKCIPIPDNITQLKKFDSELITALNKKKKILIYPEGSLSIYDRTLRDFKAGAFRYSAVTLSPILPVVTTFREATGIRKLFRKNKPIFTTTYLKPIYPDKELNQRANILKLYKETQLAMQEFINKYYEKKVH
ncbi:MAG: lysophospholipid acyltransferase family protein [Bacilli bacterium]|nr:lysophospholipid acyltransferase family protein [Bacilli bacterium]